MGEEVLLTEEEAAELLRLDPADVVALLEEGDIAGFEARGKWRVTLESVKEYVAAIEHCISNVLHSGWEVQAYETTRQSRDSGATSPSRH